VSDKYVSLERPDFHWVQSAYERDPFVDLRRALSARFEVTDVTDLNSDVSVGYELTPKVGEGKWTLRLSMVGPYAALIRHASRTPAEVIVDGLEDASSLDEAFIAQVSASAGCELLGRELLRTPVELRLFDTAPGRVRVFQALFSDVDFLPGEYDAAP